MTQTTTQSAGLRRAYARCDEIARRDKPHLHAAAQYFTRQETRDAFAATYASMRAIDDFIDDIPERSSISEADRDAAVGYLGSWLERIRQAAEGVTTPDPVWRALSDAMTRFRIPVAPWEDLATAMKTDLFVPMFTDWGHLRRYMRGASVAPAIVFMHLVLTQPDEEGDGFHCLWDYERVVAATEDLAIFCYWVHILRDVAKDLTLGGTGLVYLPQADLETADISAADLHAMRRNGMASEKYKQLARTEADRARHHLERGMAYLPDVLKVADPGNARALDLLVRTYMALLDNLATHDFDVFSSSLELSADQLSQIHNL